MTPLRIFSRLSVILALCLLPLTAFADKEAVGKTSGGGSAIDWQVKVHGHDRIELTILTPDGELWGKEFKAGQTPTFRTQDLGGTAVDGQYNYQLRVVPKISNATKKKLQDARASNDHKAARQALKDAGVTTIEQSGTITILNGSFVSPGGSESTAHDSVEAPRTDRTFTSDAAVRAPTLRPQTLDQVIPDDLIVQGSTCTGFDCVNGESFGFDTLRLKENNLRIHFEDTSSSAGFPANDWRLIANDSASGGANMFALEDSTAARNIVTVEAGSPANSIYVDSTGNIGFQQSAPALDLHVTATDTPAMRLEQTNAGGFTAQTWDIGANEANFFVRDLTGGSRLSFRIRPGAPTSSIDVSASGNVGLGTASPESKLHVFGASNVDTFAAFGNDPDGSSGSESAFNIGLAGNSFGRGAAFMNTRPDSNAVAPNPSMRIATANVTRMLIDNEGFIALGTLASTGGNPTSPIHYTNGANTALLTVAGVWQDASSREAKENINELTSTAALEALNGLNPVTYTYKVAPEDGKVGFIAEDVPEIVATPARTGLSALDIVAVVTKVVQEQQKTIEALNARIAQLEAQRQQ